LNYTYDLGELGRQYRRYLDLMAHWRRVLPEGRLLERYESMVADLEGETRRILDHCALPRDPRCFAFHETARTVRTASVDQIRRPIFRSAGAATGATSDRCSRPLAPKISTPRVR
jgi:hypothetical protein